VAGATQHLALAAARDMDASDSAFGCSPFSHAASLMTAGGRHGWAANWARNLDAQCAQCRASSSGSLRRLWPGLVMLCHSESLWNLKEAADSVRVTRRISSSRSFCTALRLGVGLILAPGLQGLGESPRAPRRRAACRCEHDAPSRWRLRLGVGSVPSLERRRRAVPQW
jgi:hypothetical protein